MFSTITTAPLAIGFMLVLLLGIFIGIALGIPITIVLILSIANPHIPVKELIYGVDKGRRKS